MTDRTGPLAAMFACAGIYGLTIGLSTPLISLVLETRGIDSGLIGVIAASAALGIFATSPFIPGLIGTFGLRRFLLVTLVFDAVLFLALPVFDSLVAWFLIRLLMGGAANAVFVTSETWVNALALDHLRGRILGAYIAVLTGCIALGPAIIRLTGIEGWTPFVTGAVVILIAGVPIWRVTDNAPQLAGHSSFGFLSFLLVAPLICGGVLLHAFKELTVLALLPVYALRNGLDIESSALTVTLVGLGSLCLQFPIGWLADHTDRRTVMIVCAALGGAGTLILPLVIGDHIGFWVFLFIWGGCFSGIYTAALVLLGERYRGMELATANVAVGVIWGAGSLLGPGVTGFAMEVRDPGGFVISLAGACALFLLAALIPRLRTRA